MNFSRVATLRNDSFTARHALIVYGSNNRYGFGGEKPSVVTQHEVMQVDGGASFLGPGVPVTESFLKLLSLGLTGGNLRDADKVQLNPDSLLGSGPGFLIWFRPASVTTIFFKTGDDQELAALSGKDFNLPPLVFCASDGGLKVMALPTNSRPNGQTRLKFSPFLNVYDDGKVCLGSARIPDGYRPDQIQEWESAFFSSAFTHTNGNASKTNVKGGLVGLWKSRGSSRLGKWPITSLKSARITLSKWLKQS